MLPKLSTGRCDMVAERLSYLPQTAHSEITQRFRQNVPPCMQTRCQWVVWKYQIVKGKRKKPPFTPYNGHAASPTNPTTWGTFDQALARYAQGSYDGIGYVCHDDIVGGDLDHCRNPKTGEIEQWAQDIISFLITDAYIEVSPSGTGFRFFINAQLPFDGRKKGDLEIYKNLRYVTFTGQHVEGSQIDLLAGEDTQNVLDQIITEYFPQPPNVNTVGGGAHISNEPQPIYTRNRSDDQILEKMLSSKKGHNISRIMAGNHQE